MAIRIFRCTCLAPNGRALLLVLIAGFATGCQPPPNAGERLLTRGLPSVPETLDPQRARSVAAAKLLGDLYEPLLILNARGELVAGAAESWEFADDGLSLRLKLRENAHWSNGDRLIAADFVRGLRALADPDFAAFYADKTPMTQNTAAISAAKTPVELSGVEALSDSELLITLARPAPEILSALSGIRTAPRHKIANLAANPPVNGAYVLEKTEAAGSFDLTRNPHFHAADDVSIEKVRYLVLNDARQEHSRFLAGELDITSRQPASRLDQLDPALVHSSPCPGISYVAFNLRLEPFRDAPLLRRALSLAVERNAITRSETTRGDIPTLTWVPPGIVGYSSPAPELMDASIEKRISLARELFVEAGFSPKSPPSLRLQYDNSEENRQIAAALQDFWNRGLGVNIALEGHALVGQASQAVLVGQAPQTAEDQNRDLSEAGMFLRSWRTDSSDPATFLSRFRSGHPSNFSGFENSQFDALLDAAARVTDIGGRYALLSRAEAILLADQAVLPIYTCSNKHLVQPWVTGFEPNPLDYHYSRYLSLDVGT